MTHRKVRAARCRALLVVAAATVAAVVLARMRARLGSGTEMPAAETAVATVAQWALWILADYVVAVIGVAAALALCGQPRQRLLRVAPALLRPVLGAVFGVALTAAPAAAASPSPVPAAAGPAVTTDPLDWSATPGGLGAIDTAAARVSRAAVSHQSGRSPPGRAPAIRTIRVAAGDCLWSLAARELAARHVGSRPADIARAWHRWYAANRASIGPDPDLLRPGELLHVPATSRQPHPSNQVSRRPS
jgi:hypothetical protein